MQRLLLALACAAALLVQLEAASGGIPAGVRNTDGSAVGNGVSIASTTATTNMNTGTLAIWARPDNVSNTARDFVSKNLASGGWEMFKRAVDGTSLNFTRYRNGAGGTNQTIVSPTGVLKAGIPTFVAVSWDTTTSANMKMWLGTLDTPAALLASTNTLGSGTALNSDSATNIIIGNAGTTAGGWPGVQWWFGLSAQVNYTTDEIRWIQFHPGAFRACIGAWDLSRVPAVNACGNGSNGSIIGTVPRMSSENLPRVGLVGPGA